MNLMLLCAGEGTRLRPHTNVLPKPAIQFLTIPLATYSLAWAEEVGFSMIVVNTFHLPEEIGELFLEIEPQRTFYSHEQPTLMGSGGGVMKAKNLLREDNFLVMNGDEVFLPSRPGQLREARDLHERSGNLATLVVMNYPGVGSVFGGVWADEAHRVLGFGKTPLPGAAHGWHYIGAVFLSKRIFDYLPSGVPSNLLYDGLVSGIKAGEKVCVAPVEGWWHETGNEKDFLEASRSALEVLKTGAGYQHEFLKDVLRRRSPKSTIAFIEAAVASGRIV